MKKFEDSTIGNTHGQIVFLNMFDLFALLYNISPASFSGIQTQSLSSKTRPYSLLFLLCIFSYMAWKYLDNSIPFPNFKLYDSSSSRIYLNKFIVILSLQCEIIPREMSVFSICLLFAIYSLQHYHGREQHPVKQFIYPNN